MPIAYKCVGLTYSYIPRSRQIPNRSEKVKFPLFCTKMYNNPLSLPNSKVQATCAIENRHSYLLYIFNKSLVIINFKY